MRIRKVFLLLTIIFLSCQLSPAQTINVDSSVTIKIKNGRYILSGTVADEPSKNEIIEKIRTLLSGNTDFSALKVIPTAAPFKPGWQQDFGKAVLKLKNWKTGVLIFSSNTNKKFDDYSPLLADILNAEILLVNKKESVQLANYRNKLVALFFLELWCKPCLLQGEELKNLYSKIPSKIEIIGVSTETELFSEEDFRKFAQRQRLPSNYQLARADQKVLDAAMKISKFQGIPITLLIYDGKLLGTFLGASRKTNEKLKEFVEKLLKENNL